MNIDPTTGLPELPEGYRFAVVRRYVLKYADFAPLQEGYEVALEKEYRGLFGKQKWRHIDAIEVYDLIKSDDEDNGKLEIAKTLTDENISRAAEKLAEREQERIESISIEQKYLGTYPPKSL